MKLAGPTSIRQKVALPLVLTTAVPLLLSLLALAMLGSLRGGTTAIVGLAFASSLVGSWLWVSRFCGRIAGSLDLMTRQSAAAAAGDLEGRLDPEGSDEIAALGRAVDAACERLGSMVARVRQTSLSLGEAAASLEAATDAIIVRTTKQDSAIEETVESIEEMETLGNC